MIDAISAVATMVDSVSQASTVRGLPQSNFADRLDNAIQGVNADVVNADKQVQALVLGQNTSLHGVMIALANAHVSLDLMVQVRNRLVDAYQEVMRMQI